MPLYRGLLADLSDPTNKVTQNAKAFARFIDEFGNEHKQTGNTSLGIKGWIQIDTDGSAHVALPQDSFGTISVNQLISSALGDATLTVAFPNGLNGVVIEYLAANITGLPAGSGNGGSMEMYATFTNSIFTDAADATKRVTIPLGKAKSIPFSATPLPTSMTLTIPGDGVTDPATKTIYTAAEA